MSPAQTLLAPVVAVAVSLGGAATANPVDEHIPAPAIGTTQTLPVLSLSLAVGGTGRESQRAVYSPPPGWYVRSHRVVATNRYGTVTFAVSTVPAGWDWRSDEQAAFAGKSSASGAVSAYKIAGGGQLASARDATTTDHRTVASSHHILVLDATARGSGFLQSGSGADLTVVAELVFLGK